MKRLVARLFVTNNNNKNMCEKLKHNHNRGPKIVGISVSYLHESRIRCKNKNYVEIFIISMERNRRSTHDACAVLAAVREAPVAALQDGHTVGPPAYSCCRKSPLKPTQIDVSSPHSHW